MLRYKILHSLKPIKRWQKYKGYIFKQYIVVALVMLAIFMPVRLIFYTYVTTSWLGNLGVMSVIAIALFILIEKNKLGWFGRYFKNRVRRLVFHRVIWLVVFFSVSTILFYSFFLYEIDKVESGYFGVGSDSDIELMTSLLVYNAVEQNDYGLLDELHTYGLYPSDGAMFSYGAGLNPQNDTKNRIIDFVSKDDGRYAMDLIMSMMLYEMNLQSGAWGSHFITVIVVEELESLWLLFFYRKMYFNKAGLTWHKDLGFYPKNVKKMVRWYNKKPTKKSEVY